MQISVFAGQIVMNKNVRHSTRLQGNQNQGAGIDRVFWENVPNLVNIEQECSQGRQRQ